MVVLALVDRSTSVDVGAAVRRNGWSWRSGGWRSGLNVISDVWDDGVGGMLGVVAEALDVVANDSHEVVFVRQRRLNAHAMNCGWKSR